MKVYHASDCKIVHPDIVHSRHGLDFGRGFYVTKLRDQAQKYSMRFTALGKTAYLHEYEYIPIIDIKIKIFDSYDEEWLDFVSNCRQGRDDYKLYDIVEGGVANDKVYQTIDFYMNGIYTKEQALRKLIYEKPTHQLCFISQEAIDRCLKFVSCEK